MLSEPGKQYAVYFFGGPSAKPSLALPAGEYTAEWISPVTGKVLKSEAVTARGCQSNWLRQSMTRILPYESGESR